MIKQNLRNVLNIWTFEILGLGAYKSIILCVGVSKDMKTNDANFIWKRSKYIVHPFTENASWKSPLLEEL